MFEDESTPKDSTPSVYRTILAAECPGVVDTILRSGRAAPYRGSCGEGGRRRRYRALGGLGERGAQRRGCVLSDANRAPTRAQRCETTWACEREYPLQPSSWCGPPLYLVRQLDRPPPGPHVRASPQTWRCASTKQVPQHEASVVRSSWRPVAGLNELGLITSCIGRAMSDARDGEVGRGWRQRIRRADQSSWFAGAFNETNTHSEHRTHHTDAGAHRERVNLGDERS